MSTFQMKLIKMSLLSKRLLSNFLCRRIFFQDYIYNELGLSYAHYHTCGNKFANVNLNRRPRSLENNMFSFSTISLNYPSLIVKFNTVFKGLLTSSKWKYYGFLWYKTLGEVDVPEFFSLLQMPDTFYSRFNIMELHVWMLLYHLPYGNRPHNLVRYGLMQALWEDTQVRAKLVDKNNLNFRDDMKKLYAKFKVSLLVYDLGFMSDDKALCSSLWYNFFNKENVDPRFLEILVSYTRHQMNYLNKLRIESLTEETEKSGIWHPLKPHYEKIFKKS